MADVLDRLKSALADRYTIEREIGRGGMATVYLAEDPKHHRHVAIKVLDPELARALGSERFLREVEVTAKLTHPHILTLIDSGEADGFLYYVMPYIEGETLRERMDREGQLPLDDALQITKEVAAALSYAHSHDVIHRDIKPENVLLSAGEAVVADFGVARAITEAGGEHLTETGISIGTPAYMSPEQASGAQKLDGRSDVYSLGCVLYEMLAAEPPYTGPTAQAVLAKKLGEATPRVSVVRERVPSSVETAIDQALAKAPADRYATVQRFAEALEGTGETAARPAKPRRARLVLLAGVALAALATIAIWTATRTPSAVLDTDLVVILPFRTAGLPDEQQHLREGIVNLGDARLTGEGGPRAVYSNTVIEAWQQAGGGVDRDLSEERALRLASDLGAGFLVTGSFVPLGDSVEAIATLIDVASRGSGRLTVQVRGRVPEILSIIEQMFIQLLALDAGVERRSLASITTTSLRAIRPFLEGQALLRGSRYDDAMARFAEAMDLDSTFALAGFWSTIASAWAHGTDGGRGVQVATAYRDRLSERDRILLDALVGGLSEAEEATRRLPDRPESWLLFGDHLYHRGRLRGIDDALERADRAFDEVRRVGPASAARAPVLMHQLEYAALKRDTSRYRVLWDQFLAESDSLEAYWHWREAAVFGDSARLAAWRASMPTLSDEDLGMIAYWSIVAEMGFEDAITAREILQARGRGQTRLLFSLLTELGRPRAAAEYRRPYVMRGDALASVIWWALLADGDTLLARQAADQLRRERDNPPPDGDGVLNRRLWGNCALGFWQLRSGERGEARETLRAIRADDRSSIRESRTVCGGVLAAILSESGPNTRALEELDSLLTSPDMAIGAVETYGMLVARLFEQEGMYERSLALVRRKQTGIGTAYYFSAVRHREEGRLALLMGDTARAIDAYSRYLDFRYAPEPELQPEADEIRALLATLVGR